MSQKMWFTTANCRAEIISTGTTLYFNLFQACLPTRHNGVENRDKAYAYDSCYTAIKERMVLKTKRNHTNEIVKVIFYCISQVCVPCRKRCGSRHCILIYFKPVCLLVTMASKTVIRPIEFFLHMTVVIHR